jgi:hypothetical protein
VFRLPFDEKEMDEISELKSKKFLSKMENGKFYSIEELAELIMNKPLTEPHGNNLPEILGNTVKNILDVAYVHSVIESQYAIGNLRFGEKDQKPYYSKA